jgi:hypothetical protein
MIEVKPGKKFSKVLLKDILPDTETALFFAKAYDLDHQQVSNLLRVVLSSTVAQALLSEGGEHSVDLQTYLIDELVPYEPGVKKGDISVGVNPPQGEILPQMWEMLEVTIAQSIKDVAEKIGSVVDALPGKQGNMVFKSLMVMNRQRPSTIGAHVAAVHHAPQKQNLTILDVSSSVSSRTIREIVGDVVAMSYKANAHLAIVSNTMTYWEPGTYSVDEVLAAAEFSGTHYEQLKPLLDMDWGTVITVADYDSSDAGKRQCARGTGNIDEVLDVSLVNRPTFLAECVGQRAARVRPLLVASDDTYGVIGSGRSW